MGDVHVGTCGYSRYRPGEDWQDRYDHKLQAYADTLPTVELNRTFYGLPRVRTAEKWRRLVDAVDDGFVFAVKAWQALTHPLSSPTWRDTGDLSPAQREHFGHLEPHEAVVDAWKATMDRVRALEAPILLLQTPPGFGPSGEHREDMRELLSTVDRRGVTVAWEPRGEWLDEPDAIADVCAALDLVHVVDPLRDDPVHTTETAYLRLHGLNADRYDYDYDYTDDELDDLAAVVQDLRGDHETVYCFFNNYEKYANAAALRDRVEPG